MRDLARAWQACNSDAAISSAGHDYNVYVPIRNARGAFGKADALPNLTMQTAEVIRETSP